MMGYYGGWGAMGWFGGILMVLFWAAVILLIVWAVRAFTPTTRVREEDTALEILRRRYAAGELSQAEYDQARRVLDGTGTAPWTAEHR